MINDRSQNIPKQSKIYCMIQQTSGTTKHVWNLETSPMCPSTFQRSSLHLETSSTGARLLTHCRSLPTASKTVSVAGNYSSPPKWTQEFGPACVACVAWVLVVKVDKRGAISDSSRSFVENKERVEYLKCGECQQHQQHYVRRPNYCHSWSVYDIWFTAQEDQEANLLAQRHDHLSSWFVKSESNPENPWVSYLQEYMHAIKQNYKRHLQTSFAHFDITMGHFCFTIIFSELVRGLERIYIYIYKPNRNQAITCSAVQQCCKPNFTNTQVSHTPIVSFSTHEYDYSASTQGTLMDHGTVDSSHRPLKRCLARS